MSDYRTGGDRYGRHRVLTPDGALPQAATRVDNSLPIYDNEILIDVKTLNIDSASFRQMWEANDGNPDGVAKQVLENVKNMGKQLNPVTGSGGMLLGTVADMGPSYSNPNALKVGDNICTLVSLTLTPLIIDKVKQVRESEQLDIEGKAVLFESGVLAKIPGDMDLNVCLALLDVAGAPPQADRLVNKGDTIYIIGTGKSGVLCAAAIREKFGKDCKILASATRQTSIETFTGLGLADECFIANALKPTEVLDRVSKVTDGKMCDLVINTANVEGTELSSVLACKQGGKVYFFNMATNFQKAALGAEGIGMDVEMIIGNGYAPDHANFTLDLYRKNGAVKGWFDKKFGS
ncbi:MAG: L-erythro-3,5-diaminohexanoate dehydrogenase [Deltaproteobacteria bacterium]|jgi:L-erythro-3,5-diaminohexanoate dehydrogenase|nr:L-erythro-3,5-diaminohexanoate dehydrogenase [Deltaproteobacteria bacterium]